MSRDGILSGVNRETKERTSKLSVAQLKKEQKKNLSSNNNNL